MNIKNKQNYISVLQSVWSLNEHAIKLEDYDSRLDCLMKCQNAVIDIGNELEKQSDCSEETIKLLEEYCEIIYNISNCQGSISQEMIMEYSVLKEKIKHSIEAIPLTYQVVFLPYKADMWDSLESIWQAFSKDERFECYVIPIPYFEANQETKQWEARYDGGRFPDYVPITNFQYYSLKDMEPDIAFVHNPFDNYNFVTSVHPDYYSEDLKKCVKKLVYVPYYVNTGFISDAYKDLPMLYRADYIVVQSENAKNTCKDKPYYDRMLPLGSPKLDKVINLMKDGRSIPEEWSDKLSGQKLLMLNTTINDLLNNESKLVQKLKNFFVSVSQCDNVRIIWRPHPLLEATVKAMRPQLYQEYSELVDYFNKNEVGVLDLSGDVSRTVIATDAYIGSSYSSVVNLFSVCNKPIYLFDSQIQYDYQNRKAERKNAIDIFSKPREIDYYAARECEEYMIEDFIEDMAGDGLNEVLEKQQELVRDLAANLDGTCGQKVYEYLAKDIVGSVSSFL